MELRQLRHFVAVAEEGSISRAAKKIFLTQPALSRQIRSLEDEIGQCLLERRAHSIRLTPTGEALAAGARELLHHAEALIDRARAAGRESRLRVGYAPSLSSGIMSVAVENFTQTHPNARVELFDLSTAEMLTGLVSETLDVALCVGDQRSIRGLKWTPLIRAEWRLAVSHNHKLARQPKVTLAEVARESLLVYCLSGYPEYRHLLTKWFRSQHQKPRIVAEYDGAENLMAAVESGLGVAIVTTRMEKLFPNRAAFVPISPAPEPLCIAIASRKERKVDKPLAVFIEELRKAAAAIV